VVGLHSAGTSSAAVACVCEGAVRHQRAVGNYGVEHEHQWARPQRTSARVLGEPQAGDSRDLVSDFENDSESWENTTVPSYLEALCALLMSIEHAYANTDRPIPADPWIVVADALNGARFHE